MNNIENLDCDVLVIGSGAAGLRAAIAAREKGLLVWVISKGPPGLGTSTSLSYGIFTGVREEDSEKKHREITLKSGRGINQQELVDVLVGDAPMRLEELLAWGIRATAKQGCLFANGRPLVWGEEVVRCLLSKARALGVQSMGNLSACKIVMRGGMAGTLAYSSKEEKWIAFRSRALILAAGGGGALYFRHDNPGQILGEGYVLALNAGAALQDMEFVQFHPAGLAERGLPRILIPSSLADRGRYINRGGEEILIKYKILDNAASQQARDYLSQALYQEVCKNSEEVFLDLRSISEQGWTGDPISVSIRDILWNRLGLRNRPFRVAPVAHHVMGGVKIDTHGRTSVPGLFAAGEVTGGLHGANRARGNALSETLVFGAKAGEAAAGWARDGWGVDRGDLLDELRASISGFCVGPADANGTNLKRRIREILWERVGIVRDQQGLRKAQDEVQNILEVACRKSLSTSAQGIRRALQLQHMARAALIIINAAILRKESRGAHYREDFPSQDDDRWRGHIQVCCSVEGKEVWSYEPLPARG